LLKAKEELLLDLENLRNLERVERIALLKAGLVYPEAEDWVVLPAERTASPVEVAPAALEPGQPDEVVEVARRRTQ
jgi:hypothetical protein